MRSQRSWASARASWWLLQSKWQLPLQKPCRQVLCLQRHPAILPSAAHLEMRQSLLSVPAQDTLKSCHSQCKTPQRHLKTPQSTGQHLIYPHVQGLADMGERPSTKPAETSYEPASDLPPSIQANREPYWQGEWRKQPYSARWALQDRGLMCYALMLLVGAHACQATAVSCIAHAECIAANHL